MKWFLPFLLFIFIGELVEEYQWRVLAISNINTNYVIGIVESCFYGYIFYKLNKKNKFKKVIEPV